MQIRPFAFPMGPALCIAVLLTAGAQAAPSSASDPAAAPATPHHRVAPPPRPVVVTEVIPGIPERERSVTEQGKGRARGFDTRRHRAANGEYVRD